jgi:hypothetical protein
MKCPCQYQIVVGGDLLQSSMEFSLVNEPTGLANDDQRIHDPMFDAISSVTPLLYHVCTLGPALQSGTCMMASAPALVKGENLHICWVAASLASSASRPKTAPGISNSKFQGVCVPVYKCCGYIFIFRGMSVFLLEHGYGPMRNALSPCQAARPY